MTLEMGCGPEFFALLQGSRKNRLLLEVFMVCKDATR